MNDAALCKAVYEAMVTANAAADSQFIRGILREVSAGRIKMYAELRAILTDYIDDAKRGE